MTNLNFDHCQNRSFLLCLNIPSCKLKSHSSNAQWFFLLPKALTWIMFYCHINRFILCIYLRCTPVNLESLVRFPLVYASQWGLSHLPNVSTSTMKRPKTCQGCHWSWKSQGNSRSRKSRGILKNVWEIQNFEKSQGNLTLVREISRFWRIIYSCDAD